ncbi:HNH endonuclease signature motif containing protein [Sphingobium yanoikuyae]|uniref:HNH endonuclease signature motif containing protein n=1 Tax=Sphingobium yanoikuyae TaxID=13690 RepID=UPI0009BFA26F|nr:HNH endonuclease signature motif containing protein [Sphingobium yanoikuyae]
MKKKYKKREITSHEIQRYINQRISIHPTSGCWEWNLSLSKSGYGCIDPETRAWQFAQSGAAHRVSYQAFNGKLVDGLVIRHRCNNRRCCNPEHLEQGTQAENVADKYECLSDRSDAALHNLSLKLRAELAKIELELSKRA